MKRGTCGLILIIAVLTLSGCTRYRVANLPPTPKAYGTQIVEVSGGKQISGVAPDCPIL